jgi:hypothetical protein
MVGAIDIWAVDVQLDDGQTETYYFHRYDDIVASIRTTFSRAPVQPTLVGARKYAAAEWEIEGQTIIRARRITASTIHNSPTHF